MRLFAVMNDAGEPSIATLWQHGSGAPGRPQGSFVSDETFAACPLFVERDQAQRYADAMTVLNPDRVVGCPESGAPLSVARGVTFTIVEVFLHASDDRPETSVSG